MLSNLARREEKINWNEVSRHFEGKTQSQCLLRFKQILKAVPSNWTEEEEAHLILRVVQNGLNKWGECAKYLEKSSKDCKNKWEELFLTLKEKWTVEEDYAIFSLHSKIGLDWSRMSGFFRNKTEKAIRTRFYSYLSRYLVKHTNSRQIMWDTHKTLLQHINCCFGSISSIVDSETRNQIESRLSDFLSPASEYSREEEEIDLNPIIASLDEEVDRTIELETEFIQNEAKMDSLMQNFKSENKTEAQNSLKLLSTLDKMQSLIQKTKNDLINGKTESISVFLQNSQALA